MRPGHAARRYTALCAAFIAGASICVGLGRWQLERAEQARSLAARYVARGELAAVTDVTAAVAADPERLRFRKLRLEGHYVEGANVLLDNVTQGAVAGYYVLTPFAAAGTRRHVLVNRGWIEADPDRGVVPSVDVDSSARTISGRMDRLPSVALTLEAAPETVRDGVYRVSFPTVDELERLLGVDLAPFQVLLDSGLADGFQRRWKPETTRARRNTAYAGQWFIMAVGASGLAVWAAARAYRATRNHADSDETST